MNMNAEFTVPEIAAASGKAPSDIAQRIHVRKQVGMITGRKIPHARGGPMVYTYEEVKIILRNIRGGAVPSAQRDYAETDLDMIAALRRQLRTDGFQVAEP